MLLLNSQLVKKIILDEAQKRIPLDFDCSFIVKSVSPLGSLDLEQLVVRRRNKIVAYAERGSVSGIYSAMLGGSITIESSRAFIYPPQELISAEAAIAASGKSGAGNPLSGIGLNLSIGKLTIAINDFHEDMSLRIAWNKEEKYIRASSRSASIEVKDIDLRKKTAFIKMMGVDTEDYGRFFPGIKGLGRGIASAEMRIAFSGNKGFLADIKSLHLDRAVIRHSMLDDQPFFLSSLGFSGTVFASDTIAVVKGKASFPGFEVPVRLYKRHNLILGTISATRVTLNAIAQLLAKGSEKTLSGFRMDGDLSFSITFSARLGLGGRISQRGFDPGEASSPAKLGARQSGAPFRSEAPNPRVRLERFRFLPVLSKTKQLSNRLDFLKKGFYCYAFNERGDIRRLTIGENNPNFTSIGALPKYVYGAVISCEDKGFFKHHGIDFWGIQRALRANFSGKRGYLSGGSTVTQQLAKNLFLSKKKNIVRKLEEFLLSCELEATLSKERIMEIYLNAIELGPDVFGIGTAARLYFGKSAHDLTALEAAYLASTLIRPRFFYSIFFEQNRISEYWQGRLMRLLNAMVSLEYITPDECALNDPACFSFNIPGKPATLVSDAPVLPAEDANPPSEIPPLLTDESAGISAEE